MERPALKVAVFYNLLERLQKGEERYLAEEGRGRFPKPLYSTSGSHAVS